MMKNPTVEGTYWVWRVSKDIDRNIACLLDWHDNAWQNDTSEFNDSVAHTREFAAWSGPIERPFPPESVEEVAAEYARGRPGEAVLGMGGSRYPTDLLGGPRCTLCGQPARDLRAGVRMCRDPECVKALESGPEAAAERRAIFLGRGGY